MTLTKPERPLLNEQQAAFLGGPVAVNLASHDVALVPSLSRAYGCRVSADRREVTVFVSKPRSETILCDLAAGAQIAVVFSRPKTHETLQIKGACARIQPLEPGDREIMLASSVAFSTEIIALGYSENFSHALMTPATDEAVGIVFLPVAVFEQTPGPKAGMRLDPRR